MISWEFHGATAKAKTNYASSRYIHLSKVGALADEVPWRLIAQYSPTRELLWVCLKRETNLSVTTV